MRDRGGDSENTVAPESDEEGPWQEALKVESSPFQAFVCTMGSDWQERIPFVRLEGLNGRNGINSLTSLSLKDFQRAGRSFFRGLDIVLEGHLLLLLLMVMSE